MTAGATANPSRAGQLRLLAQHVDDLLDVMGDESTTVVAHSFGCVVAVSAAITRPGRFRGLGLWEPQVPWMDFWPRSVRRGLEAMAVEADTDALAERVYASMVGDEAWRRLPEELKAHRRAEGMAFQRDVVLGLSPPFRWEDLKVPSLFGVGLQSWPFSQDAATRLAESLGAELFTIAGAGSQRACDPSPAICGVRATQHRSAGRRGHGRPGLDLASPTTVRDRSRCPTRATSGLQAAGAGAVGTRHGERRGTSEVLRHSKCYGRPTRM